MSKPKGNRQFILAQRADATWFRRRALAYCMEHGLVRTGIGKKNRLLGRLIMKFANISTAEEVVPFLERLPPVPKPKPKIPIQFTPPSVRPDTPVPTTKRAVRIPDEEFFESREWKRLRYQALLKYGAACQCCGATRADGVKFHVDHIKPRSKFPELQWNLDNLQVLCEHCNLGKGAWDETDWRDNKPVIWAD